MDSSPRNPQDLRASLDSRPSVSSVDDSEPPGTRRRSKHPGPPSRSARRARKPAASRSPRRRRGGFPWRALRLFLVLFTWMLILGIGVVGWFAHDLPDPEAEARVTRRPSVTLLAADGREIAAFGDLHGETVRARDAPPALIRAILATEDRRFLEHFGVDVWGILRAMITNLRAGHVVQGGSTITQQVAKNLFLTQERTFRRKIQEVLLSIWLERSFTKEQILTLYINRVYLGAGTHGVDAAARRYFQVGVRDISIYQAALLAGLPKAPSRFNPVASPERAHSRTLEVLQNMVEAGWLTPEAAKAAAAEAPNAIPGIRRAAASTYFADWVLEQVDDYAGARDRDLIVQTTLDLAAQQAAEKAVTEVMDAEAGSLNAKQAALVALNFDGAVRAMVGGRDHGQAPFNRAAQARRQPGSAFKPFVFLAGLESGLAPESRLEDTPITVGTWSPGNYTKRYRGNVSMTEALALSLNTVSVRITEQAGRGHVVKVAKRLGVVGDLAPHPSIALGVFEISPLDLTTAYAPFANGGQAVAPYGIVTITDRDGALLYQRQPSGDRPVMTPEQIEAMNKMLEAVVSWGTGKGAALPGKVVRGKTGTTQEYRDAWFVGYTNATLAGVWVGNDDSTPHEKRHRRVLADAYLATVYGDAAVRGEGAR
ncbi:transglycosylase domain-containing protein [Pararhodospirillum photometricum]|uniref:Penicillin-binding protein 1A n=1 Tax=Pararhodospirillum photometricum DSM 122 TaxID=1150469 RepID=H6SP29_PARPM|nr:PBP1A family penicillin-binding protein [Pararhodospirillum photometricum]CCG07101.1 Penicillin-binding protein 1A [Pararhodospirillum photometricum DSM 122]